VRDRQRDRGESLAIVEDEEAWFQKQQHQQRQEWSS
jgi:hypothetical protein